MDILRGTKIDFMKYRRFWVAVSVAVMVIAIVAVFIVRNLNIGIDFAGGAQITLKFAQAPAIEDLRALVAEAGVEEAQIQRIGEVELNEVMIKTRLAEGETLDPGASTSATAADAQEQPGVTKTGALVTQALDARYNADLAGRFDLNRKGGVELAALLLEADPDGLVASDLDTARVHYDGIAEAILDVRRKKGLFAAWSDLDGAPGVGPEVRQVLESRASLGKYAVLGFESVSPQIGSELRSKGKWAVGLSLLGMLVYIWVRFELQYGVGAMMATLHDVIVTLGIFAFFGFEFNLTTIAAFLTLVGYSVNDTVVVFDRVRENLRKSRREPLIQVMNRSINETLSRTILTGGSTFLACLTLFIYGGEAVKGFAFVILVGIVVGTYSSIYIASPFALLWDSYFPSEGRSEADKPAGRAAAKAGGAGRGAKLAPR